jgi:N-methylhydantoinase B/oxoprolinase/acetone carboxylase alpha subunit
MVDSLIIGKQTSRNLGGPHLPDTIVGGGIGSTDSGSGLFSNPQILHNTQNSILSENSTIYRDYGYNNIVRGQKSTPSQNTSKKRNSRSINCSSTS